MSRPENPCAPDCPNRTVTCKFDGSCGRYGEYRQALTAHSEEASRENARQHAAAGVLNDGYDRRMRRMFHRKGRCR